MNNHEKKAKKAIENCYWRKNFAGVSVCAAACLPCAKVIASGRCATVIELFNKYQKEEER